MAAALPQTAELLPAGKDSAAVAAAAACAHTRAHTHSVPQLSRVTATGVIVVIQINGGCLIAF